VVEHRAERAEEIWGPISEQAHRDFARFTLAELRMLGDFFRRGREMNEENMKRVKKLRFE
jgi:hypothetical protein